MKTYGMEHAFQSGSKQHYCKCYWVYKEHAMQIAEEQNLHDVLRV